MKIRITLLIVLIICFRNYSKSQNSSAETSILFYNVENLFDVIDNPQTEDDSYTPKGEHGFGYDPVFIPAGFDQTFGQLDAGIKKSISHRARAMSKFLSYLDHMG